MILGKEQTNNQWNRRENPERDHHKYSQLMFDQGAKAIQQRKEGLFNKWCWNNRTSTCKKKKMNLDKGLILFAKINSKWILGLNVKHKTVKCFGDNTEEILDDLGNGDVFFRQHQQHDT